jgi:hypothetical protein
MVTTMPLGWYSGGNATPLCSSVCHLTRAAGVVAAAVTAAASSNSIITKPYGTILKPYRSNGFAWNLLKKSYSHYIMAVKINMVA